MLVAGSSIRRSTTRAGRPAGGEPRAAADQHRRITRRSPGHGDRVANLFLAADYVRTNVDLATMEGANEAGRQAANALLHASGSRHPPARIETLWQPSELDAVRSLDAQRYAAGEPNALDLIPAGVPL